MTGCRQCPGNTVNTGNAVAGAGSDPGRGGGAQVIDRVRTAAHRPRHRAVRCWCCSGMCLRFEHPILERQGCKCAQSLGRDLLSFTRASYYRCRQEEKEGEASELFLPPLQSTVPPRPLSCPGKAGTRWGFFGLVPRSTSSQPHNKPISQRSADASIPVLLRAMLLHPVLGKSEKKGCSTVQSHGAARH